MRFFPFAYKKNSLHIVQLFFIGGFGLLMLVFALLFFNASQHATGSDVSLFLGMMVAFLIPAIGLCLFSYLHFNRMRRFYQDTTTQYGVTVDNKTVHHLYFDALKKREWTIDRSAISSVVVRMYRRIRYIDMKVGRKTYFINTNAMVQSDFEQLLTALQQTPVIPVTPTETMSEPIDRDRSLKHEHLKIVVALMQLLEAKTSLTFFGNWKKINESEYLFGYEEDVPQSPYFQLRILGSGAGDYYSGSVEYENLFKLHDAVDSNGKWIDLYYIHTATNLAGSCSLFQSDYFSELELAQFETEFYKLIRSDVQIPNHFPSTAS